MTMESTSRVLVVEIRADRAGFAVLDTYKGLLDYGTMWFDTREVTGHWLNRFLWRRQASTLIMRSSESGWSIRRKKIQRMVRIEAQKRRLKIVYIPDRILRSYWARQSCRNKYQVAEVLSAMFPQFSRPVPAHRKIYDPEARSVLLFDSLAVAAVFLDFFHQDAEAGP